MQTKFLILFTCLISGLFLKAQEYDSPLSTDAIASAGQSAVLPNAFSALGNPALMPQMKRTTAGISVSNRYFLTELKYGGAGLVQHLTKTDAVGVALQFDGTRNFKQTTLALAYSKALHPRFNAGISFQWLNTFQQGIGNSGHFLAKAGVSFQPDKKLLLGVTVFNPFTTRMVLLTNERIPTYFKAGLAYTVSPQVVFYVEDRMSLLAKHNLKLAIHYSPIKQLTVIAGFQNANTPLSFGCRIKTKNLLIWVAFQYHQVLGISPALGLGYETE